MAYNIQFKAPEGWKSKISNALDDNGIESLVLEAECGACEFAVYVSDMPEDESAEDQAFANYVEMIGFDEDSDSDAAAGENPVIPFTFNSKKAWGFAAYDEDDRPMRLFTQEPRKGMLVIYFLSAPGLDELNQTQDLIERAVRIK